MQFVLCIKASSEVSWNSGQQFSRNNMKKKLWNGHMQHNYIQHSGQILISKQLSISAADRAIAFHHCILIHCISKMAEVMMSARVAFLRSLICIWMSPFQHFYQCTSTRYEYCTVWVFMPYNMHMHAPQNTLWKAKKTTPTNDNNKSANTLQLSTVAGDIKKYIIHIESKF